MLGRGVKRKRSCSEETEEAQEEMAAAAAEVGADDGVLPARGRSHTSVAEEEEEEVGADDGVLAARGRSDTSVAEEEVGADDGVLPARGRSDTSVAEEEVGADDGVLPARGRSHTSVAEEEEEEVGADDRVLPARGRSDTSVAEEEEEEEVGADDGVLPARGRSDAARLQQRQLVMSLCLDKLQRHQAGVELGLRRSVLLINTLRQIQEDMQKDVGAGTACSPPGGLDPSVPPCSVCGPDASGSLSDTPLLGGVDRDWYLQLRDSVSLKCPGCAEDEQEGLSPPSPAPPPSLSGPPWTDGSSSTGSRLAQTPAGDLAPDDVFEDIDTSMYDTWELPPAAWALGSYWPDSVSLWGDEELKTTCSAGHASHAGTMQSRLTDLNDLDHIMEILVNS